MTSAPAATPAAAPTTAAPSAFKPDEEAYLDAWLAQQSPSFKRSIWHDSAIDMGWQLCVLIKQEREGFQEMEDVIVLANPNPKKGKAIIAAAEKYLCPA